MKLPFGNVEPEWAGATVAIIGGGPSLTQEQVTVCRGRCRVIAVNTSYLLAPWADALYFCDEAWYGWHREAKAFRRFAGIKVALANARTTYSERGVLNGDPAIRVLRNYGGPPEFVGLCENRDGVYTGRNSGNQAIQLAAHLGARRVLLLGFDMRAQGAKTHWHMAHKRPTDPNDFNQMLTWFAPLVEPCRKRGIEVVNCTPGSAVECFPRATINDALAADESERAGERARREVNQKQEYFFRTS